MRTVPAPSLHILSLIVLLSLPPALSGQSGVTLSGGPASWDLSGTGTGTTLALRWDRDLTAPATLGPIALDVGVGWFQDGEKGQGAVDLLLPEVGVRLGLPGPFAVGLGGGYAIGLEDRTGDDLTLWAALGADFALSPLWSFRPELRVRSVDPWVGTVADYSVGIRRALR